MPLSRSSSATPVRDSTDSQPLERQALLAHGLGEGVLARLDHLLAALLGEPVPDLVAWPAAERTNDSQSREGPRRVGLGGEHLDDVAVVEPALERDEAAVDPGADAVVADLGVHGVGEVDGGRPGGQRRRAGPSG